MDRNIRTKNEIVADNYFVIMPINFIRSKNYTNNEKMVYIYLFTYGIKSKMAFPKIDRIAKDLSMSKVTVIKCIKNLCEKKLLAVRKRRNGSKENNIYYLTDIKKNGEPDIEQFENNKALMQLLD